LSILDDGKAKHFSICFCFHSFIHTLIHSFIHTYIHLFESIVKTMILILIEHERTLYDIIISSFSQYFIISHFTVCLILNLNAAVFTSFFYTTLHHSLHHSFIIFFYHLKHNLLWAHNDDYSLINTRCHSHDILIMISFIILFCTIL